MSDAPQPRWQDQYADPEWQAKLTQLTPEEEAAFQAWAKQLHAPITDDYDMRGFWKFGGDKAVSPVDGQMHYTDRYKTPLHDSFSGESMYSLPDIPKPSWNEQDQLVDPSGAILYDERALAQQRKAQAIQELFGGR